MNDILGKATPWIILLVIAGLAQLVIRLALGKRDYKIYERVMDIINKVMVVVIMFWAFWSLMLFTFQYPNVVRAIASQILHKFIGGQPWAPQ